MVCRHSIFCSVRCSSADFFVPDSYRCAEDSARYSATRLSLRGESRIVLTPIAGVAELADALDSKSNQAPS